MKIFFNQYSDRARGTAAVRWTQLVSNLCETLKNITRSEKLLFCLNIKSKCSNIINEILNVTIDTGPTFIYGEPKGKQKFSR